MRRGRARHPPPSRLHPAIAAAIDDDALSPLAQLERQRPGMRVLVEAARRRLPRIDNDQALAGLQPLESGLRCLRRGAALRLRTGQDEIDDDPVLLDRVVEKSESAIAV